MKKTALPRTVCMVAMIALAGLSPLTACIADDIPTPALIAPDIATDAPAPTAAPTITPTATPTPVIAAAVAPQPDVPVVQCEHLLWPVCCGGGTWTYRLNGPAGTTELVLTSSLTPEGVALTAGEQSVAIYCGDRSLGGLPPLPIAHPDLGAGITGINPIGGYLPAPGDLLPLGHPTGWDQELDASGTLRLPFVEGGDTLLITSGKIVQFNETDEMEMVSVPAGEFLTLPVRQDVLFDLQVQFPDGVLESVIIGATVRNYYAEGIGLIRTIYDGGTVSTPDGAWSLESGWTLELIAVSLP